MCVARETRINLGSDRSETKGSPIGVKRKITRLDKIDEVLILFLHPGDTPITVKRFHRWAAFNR